MGWGGEIETSSPWQARCVRPCGLPLIPGVGRPVLSKLHCRMPMEMNA